MRFRHSISTAAGGQTHAKKDGEGRGERHFRKCSRQWSRPSPNELTNSHKDRWRNGTYRLGDFVLGTSHFECFAQQWRVGGEDGLGVVLGHHRVYQLLQRPCQLLPGLADGTQLGGIDALGNDVATGRATEGTCSVGWVKKARAAVEASGQLTDALFFEANCLSPLHQPGSQKEGLKNESVVERKVREWDEMNEAVGGVCRWMCTRERSNVFVPFGLTFDHPTHTAMMCMFTHTKAMAFEECGGRRGSRRARPDLPHLTAPTLRAQFRESAGASAADGGAVLRWASATDNPFACRRKLVVFRGCRPISPSILTSMSQWRSACCCSAFGGFLRKSPQSWLMKDSWCSRSRLLDSAW